MVMISVLALLTSAVQAPSFDLTHFRPLAPNSGDGNYQISPPYANAPELTSRPDVPKGQVFRFYMDSQESKTYPATGTQKPYKREVVVYIPAGYVEGTPTPFLVAQDAMTADIMPTILDNMIFDHRLPSMAAVMIKPGPGPERSIEYDTMSGRYAEFIQSEVLPRVSHDYHVTFTKDPNARMSMGGSSGGACALSMAWFHPEWYHRVLSYSGSFTDLQHNTDYPHGAWEYHDKLIANARRKPIRLWLEVGEKDIRFDDPESTHRNWVLANLQMADVLKAKHYHYQLVFAHDAKHVDGAVVRQTLPKALEYVWKGFRR